MSAIAALALKLDVISYLAGEVFLSRLSKILHVISFDWSVGVRRDFMHGEGTHHSTILY